jgi:hypothetical protein
MQKKALDRRLGDRTRMVLGIKLPKEQPERPEMLAHTLDVSSWGARIGALHQWMEPGIVLVIQRKHSRVRCRVTWSRQVGPGEVQIGIEFLDRAPEFWGVDLEDNRAGVWLPDSER